MSDYKGKHYNIKNLFESEFFNRHPPPKLIQNPYIPIWVVGAWPYEKSMKRALNYEGIIPTIKNKRGQFVDITPKHITEIKAYVQKNRSKKEPFDIIVEGLSPGEDSEGSRAIVKPFIEAGATWWIESDWTTKNLEPLFKRVIQGPPSF